MPGEKIVSIKERLIQFVMRGKDELSSEAKKSEEALEGVRLEAEVLGKALDSAKDARGLVKGLESTQRAATQAERSLVQTDLQIKELRDALTAAPESAGLQQSLKDAERESRRAQKALDDLQARLSDQEKAAQAAGIDTSKLADEEKRLATEVDNAKQALASNGEQLKALQREQAAAARATAEHTSRLESARQTMSAGVKQVLVFAAAYVSLSAAFGLVQKGLNLVRDGIYSMLQTGDQFELLDKRMASLMGSVAGGEQATAWIKDFAKNTPLEVADVTEAFALLKSYGLDPMDGALQAVVDKNEQLGGGMERLTGISSALGQAYAKQKLQTEEILQLVERGVPVWGLLEKVTGKNTAQLQKLATEGRLGKDVIKALIAEMGKSAQGAAADSMNTLTGLVSNLKDVWSGFLDRVSSSGALDFAKNKLREVANTIDQMDKDGRLDKLAQALSNAFVQGAGKVEEFAKKLLDVDFKNLTDDSSAWLNNLGRSIDDVALRVKLFTAPFRTMFNGLTSGLSLVAGALLKPLRMVMDAIAQVAQALPDMLGGEKIRSAVNSARDALNGLSAGLAEQIMQDGQDIRDAWDTTSKHGVDSQQKVVDAAKGAEAEKLTAAEATTQKLKALNDSFAQSALDATAAGKRGIVDMADALQLIDTASTVQQVEGLRGALLKAFQDGALTLEQYQQSTGVLNGKLGELGKAAGGAAGLVSDLDEKLGDLASVQAAISSAKTDVDIRNITAALRKLYDGGKITAAQYNEEVKKASEQQKELKKAVTEGKKAQDDKNDSDKEAIKTSEDLRRESGKRMEEERRASGEAMERNRKDGDEVERDIGAMEDFFGGVMTRAREPLAAMSAAALEAFDKLSGISTVDLSLDTGSLEETTASLEKATTALGQMQAAANTVGMSGLGTWMTTTAVRSQRIQVQFLEQKAALQQLTEGYEAGSIGIQDFVEDAEQARSSLNLLNDSDLRTLEGAIEGARQKMQQLQEGSKSTLTSLREELMGVRGETEDLERSKFAGRRAELQQQIADAQKAGDPNALNNLQQAMATLRQIESETTQKRQQEEQQKRADTTKATPAAQTQAPAQIIRLQPANGPAVDVTVQSDTDKTNLLGVLESAGLRSL